MRALWLVCALAWACLAQAQPMADKWLIAKAIVSTHNSQSSSTYSVDDARNNYLADMKKITDQIKSDAQKNYPKLSSLKISDIVDQYMAANVANFDKFVENASRMVDREIDTYALYFSVQELEEILAKKPEITSEKHRKFIQDTLPVSRSIAIIEARGLGEKAGRSYADMQRALIFASGEKD